MLEITEKFVRIFNNLIEKIKNRRSQIVLNLHSMLKAGIIGGFGILTVSSVLETKMKEYDTVPLKPIDTISIIMSSLNEGLLIGTALSSIRNQSIIQQYPEYFELILADSCSTDGTTELAEPYVDRIIIAPRGKLTARNIATNEAKGNIIVSVDSDTYYPFHYLNTLLKPFNDYTNSKYENVIGTFGSTFDYTIPYIPGKLFSFGDSFYNTFFSRNRMTGRNSAFWKHAFYLAERFNENINQLNMWDVFFEEEYRFGNRLSKLGKIIYNINASCYHLGGMKSMGRLGIGDKKFRNENKFGEDRF